MLIYLGTFIIATFFIYFGAKSRKKLNRFILISLAICIPCLLASVRDVSIGTDTSGYVINIYSAAVRSSGLEDFYNTLIYHEWKYVPVSSFEYGYTTLVYFGAKLFNDFSASLFLNQIVIILPIVFALLKYEKRYGMKAYIGYMFFMFMFYNVSLNAVRQFMSVSILFYGIATLTVDKSRNKYLLCLVLSVLFHTSGVLGIIPFLFFNIQKRHKTSFALGSTKISAESMQNLLLILLCVLFLFYGNNILSRINLSIISSYINYLPRNVNFSFNQIVLQLPYLALMYKERKQVLEFKNISIDNKNFLGFNMLMFIIQFVFSQLSTVTVNSWRINLIFSIFLIVIIPLIISFEKKMRTRKLILLISIAYIVIYWFYMFAYLGKHNTVPYVFGMQ